MSAPYVHGYRDDESTRLHDQAGTLTELVHAGVRYGAGRRVLEAGCGVGAQTLTLAAGSPDAELTAIDASAASVAEAERRVRAQGFTNVTFAQGDLYALPFAPASFDDVFVCFVLEHLLDPVAALRALRGLLRPGGTIAVIEGDHGSTFFHPDDADARAAIACQVELQRQAGGDALIGRRVYPLLVEAGFADVEVAPEVVYVDASRPALVDGFTERTFTAMIEGVRDASVAAGLIEPERFDAGLHALRRTKAPDGVFSYTFFKGVGRAPG